MNLVISLDVARPAGRQPCKLKLFRRGGACKQNPCTAQCTLAGPGPLRARAALASTVAKDLSTSMQNRRWCTHAFHHIHSHKGNCDTYNVCRAGHPRVIHFTKRLLRGSSAGHRRSCAGHPIYKGFTVRVIRSPRLAFKNLKGLRCGVQGPPGARPALQRHRVWNLTL